MLRQDLSTLFDFLSPYSLILLPKKYTGFVHHLVKLDSRDSLLCVCANQSRSEKVKRGLSLVERSPFIYKHQLLSPFSFGVKWLLAEPRDTNESQKTLNLQMAFHYNFIDCDSVIKQYKAPFLCAADFDSIPLKNECCRKLIPCLLGLLHFQRAVGNIWWAKRLGPGGSGG